MYRKQLFAITAALLVLTTPAVCLGQDAIKSDLLQNVVPPSPTAASLAKYGEVPVGLYNGVPDISIPIYQLGAGTITLPVSISYHAAGIKVEEVASPVGLGWSLNAGGAIVRQTRGLPDESPYGYLYKNQLTAQYIANQMSPAQQQAFFHDFATGLCDTEPDIFFYNIGGQSGKFYFDASGNAVTIPVSKMKFTLSGSSWQMVDNNGIHYIFDQPEQTTSTSASLSGGIPAVPDPHTSVSSWFISKIYKPGTAYQVLFEYDDFQSSYFTLAPQTKYVTISANTGCGQNPPVGPGELLSNVVAAKRLKKITGLHETVEFIYSPLLRLDQETDKALERIVVKNLAGQVIRESVFTYSGLANQPPGQQSGLAMYNNRLVLLNCKTVNGSNENGGTHSFTYNPGVLPGRLSYSQDLWGYHNGASNPVWLVPTTTISTSTGSIITVPGANRLVNENFARYGMLEKITYPTGGATAFEYEGNTIAGYEYDNGDNGQPGTASVGSQLNSTTHIYESPVFTITDCNPADGIQPVACQSVVNNSGCGGGLANLECPMVNIVGVDNNASIPMNASTTVYLNPGQYKLTLDLTGVDPQSTVYTSAFAQITFPRCPVPGFYAGFFGKMGGLRIKKMTHTTADGTVAGQKFYSYNYPVTGLSSGSISRLPEYNSEIESIKSVSLSWGGTGWYNCKYIGVSTTSNYPLANTKGGTVGYGYVKVRDGQQGELGYTESWFTSPATHPDSLMPGFPYPPAIDYDWQRGFLTKEISWRNAGQDANGNTVYQKVQQKETQYSTLFPQSYQGLKTGQRFFDPQSCGTGQCHQTAAYTLATGLFLPVSETVKQYYPHQGSGQAPGSDSVVTTTTTAYNSNNYQPASRTSQNSENGTVVTQLKYPADFTGDTALALLLTSNRVNEVVEQVSTNTTLQQELSRSRASYGVYTASGQVPYADIDSVLRSSGGALPEAELTVQLRDGNSNILQATGKDGIPICFVYGYGGTLPVAKIAGTTWAAVQAQVNIAALQQLDGAALRTALAPLRSIAGALVTTYTYTRGVGISSITDAAGETQYFEYDVFNRLAVVKDKNGYVIKRICYNYAGQAEDCPLQ